MTATTDVSVRRHDRLAFVRLEGESRLNPIGTATCNALVRAIRDVETDGRTRAVIVHGAGRAFSAGADIDEIASYRDSSDFERFIHIFTDTLDLIEASRLPFIAAIDGPAFGGGLELALACDLRITGSDVKLGLPEAKLGVLPGAGGTQRLPRLIPRAIALEMLMLGTPITGARGYQLGLVNRLADLDSILAEAEAVALELATGAASVAARAKSLVRDTETVPLAAGVVRERAVATELFASPDGREGFAAFVARRHAKFAGGQPG